MEILSLGEKIKIRRKNLNMTLKDLAGDRITPGQISLVESGKSNPSMDLLEYLALALNTSVEYLMESEETQAEKVCVYYENIAEAHILNNEFQLGEQFLENAMYYAEKYNLDYRKARNLYLRAIIGMSKEEMGLAQQYFLAANAIFIKLNHQEEVVKTYLKLGKITLSLNAYHSSCSYFQQAEKVFQDNNIGDDFLLGQIYYFTALIYFRLDDMDKSINYSYLAKEKFEEINNKKQYAKTLLLLSKEYIKKEDLNNAIKYSKKSLEIFRENDEKEYIGDIENDLGKLFYEFENIEESFIHLNKAKEMRADNEDAVIETLSNICENYIKLKDLENSKKTLQEILSKISDNNHSNIIKYYLLKYRVDVLEKNMKEAEETLLMALHYAENMNLVEQAGEISIITGKFYIDNNEDTKAATYLHHGVENFKKLGIIKYL
ncbi:tetratricopeptide repeat/DNA binding domain-containing protein [Clostridium pasteurianum DSM 525 = ATCC 6013]|uniref:Helix-turn-helix domain protein n=1 Tax=Clostridium pasteurianum DSM 525 = ATCC 6013 TaxID=1262449 RepID=A0A0H3J279_CLOPA|nr:helix-turn-helix transcriptional regulator [Clostridium pasteurianum]AJA47529.1 tetratricopeptide repeat/DNA binding domain-containing protein [Clostridium pasteurianum DSM 525 = ATCC 6013]AJA51517.1 tetratricopeptide repeat/DNA binding domain-containing protein [Clostridium pasteurianum DSM 525 = ATCC 6013]AOZ74846.1 XRE family transcriptional regulator [Clostridium pasteurianum DSM 525 = ATCC 6013]AOZ78642.1 XRE family transcriptional regulator [Clostridium pasteurianum]ELP57635.1 Xre fam